MKLSKVILLHLIAEKSSFRAKSEFRCQILWVVMWDSLLVLLLCYMNSVLVSNIVQEEDMCWVLKCNWHSTRYQSKLISWHCKPGLNNDRLETEQLHFSTKPYDIWYMSSWQTVVRKQNTTAPTNVDAALHGLHIVNALSNFANALNYLAL